MKKKIFAFCLALIMLSAVLISGCEQKEKPLTSSALTNAETSVIASEEASSEEASSKVSSLQASTSSNKETSSKADISSALETSSEKTSSIKAAPTFLRPESTSSTSSSDIKQYKKSKVVLNGIMDLMPRNCKSNGISRKVRLDEFKSVVNEKYFNTYFLELDEYFVSAAKIIADAGGSVWIVPDFYSSKSGKNLQEITQEMDDYFKELEAYGIQDVVNGFFWDCPTYLWQEKYYSNQDFLDYTETLYKKYGLRNFAIFTFAEFLPSENFKPTSEKEIPYYDRHGKVAPQATKYITDIGCDQTDLDVRDGIDYSEDISKWEKYLSVELTDGKSIHIARKKYLQKYIGHRTNFWYSPRMLSGKLAEKTAGIAKENEAFIVAQLKFMAEDLLYERFAGGIISCSYLSTQYLKGFDCRTDIINSETGNFLTVPKNGYRFTELCKLLREVTDIFNQETPAYVTLDV